MIPGLGKELIYCVSNYLSNKTMRFKDADELEQYSVLKQ